MAVFKKKTRLKSYRWLCLLALLLCVCVQLPEYCEEGKPFDPATQFCFADSTYAKCGGRTYTPGSQRCGPNQTIENRCNDTTYVPQGTSCVVATNPCVVNPGSGACCDANPGHSSCGNATYTLALSAIPADCAIGLMGIGTYSANTVANISVTAVPGCTFIGWTPTAGVSNSGNRSASVLMSQHRVLTANFTGSPTGSGSVDIEMIFVAGGTFTMGCTPEQGNDCQDREMPPHQVTVSDFYIAKFPVTQAQWVAVMGNNNPSHFREESSRPVENVNLDDIQIFITNINHITERRYRLPTEAEWEYAARGGVSGMASKYAGGNDIDSVAWYAGNSVSRTWPVGRKEPNVLGIYDMSGNVAEWVGDWYGRYSELDKDNPVGPPAGTSRVIRGGSWNDPARSCRVSNRDGRAPSVRNNFTGFRLVLLPEASQ